MRGYLTPIEGYLTLVDIQACHANSYPIEPIVPIYPSCTLAVRVTRTRPYLKTTSWQPSTPRCPKTDSPPKSKVQSPMASPRSNTSHHGAFATPPPTPQSESAHSVSAGLSLQDLQFIARQRNSRHLRQYTLSHQQRQAQARYANGSRAPMDAEKPPYMPTEIAYEQGRSSTSWTSADEDWPDGVDDEIMGVYMEKDYDLPSYSSQPHRSYQHQPRRPLVDLVKNEWRTNPKYGQTQYNGHSERIRGRGPPGCGQIVTAPRLRRYLLLFFLLWGLCWGSWKWWVRPRWIEHLLLSESLDERMKSGEGWFGSNVRPTFTDLVQIQTLDRSLVQSKDERKRFIVVGNVHGCKDECKILPCVRHNLARNTIAVLKLRF